MGSPQKKFKEHNIQKINDIKINTYLGYFIDNAKEDPRTLGLG